MARKSKSPRLLTELPPASTMPGKRAPGRPSGLYLLELRSRASQSELPRRKLVLPIASQECEEGRPREIKITHL